MAGLAILGWLTTNPPAETPATQTPSTPRTDLPEKLPSQQEFIKNPNQGFVIDYDPNYNLYIISILTPEFDKMRSLAEQALVEKLGIPQSRACELNVSISTPHYVNPNQIETYDTFSFCSN